MPQPSWHIVSEPEEGLPVPSVVKAPDRQGQKGLTLVRSEEELPGAIARAIEESRSGVAIIEELVDGPEVTVNAFSLRGDFHPLTVTDRLTAEPPAFGVALAHVWPSEAGGRRPRWPSPRSARSGSRTVRATPSCGSGRTARR